MHRQFDYLRFVHQLDHTILPLAVVAAVLTVAQPLLIATLLGWLLTRLVTTGATTTLLMWTAGAVIVIAVLNTAKSFCDYRYNLAATALNDRVDEQVTQKLMTVSYATFLTQPFRDEYSAAISGWTYTGGFQNYIHDQLIAALTLIISALAGGAVIVRLMLSRPVHSAGWSVWVNGWRFATLLLILLGTVLAITVASNHLSARLGAAFYQFNVRLNTVLNYYVNELLRPIANGKHLRLYDPDHWYLNQDREATDRLMTRSNRLWIRRSQAGMLVSVGLVLAVGCLYLLVSLKALSGAIAIGTVVLSVGYLSQLITAIAGYFMLHPQAAALYDALDHYLQFLNYPDPPAAGSIPVEKRLDRQFSVHFDDVSYRYPGATEDAVSHVTLTLEVGQRLALVGPNGSGKTTLIKLLIRMLTPTSGRITLNGFDIQKYDLAEYQALFATVFQDFQLFAFSVAENVAVSPNVDRARVAQALTIAGVAERVCEWPKGMDTALTRELDPDGVTVSGGEAQKLAIARAWYKDSPFIVLDEPTAALDPVSEYEIYQHFDALIADRTALYISHRMSATRFADQILVMSAGRFVQRGTHAALMAEPGLYRDLFSAQADLYQ
ncbi:ABC transporter ATP-binding protein [Lacticaseibacillus absianus]|uniref:ABC transporter ATP-binding protein n=1 Tax=Lacticaseibacillus absianus TaxID=2729623 RepID=UPI0015CE1AF0|nr:ABC transporter ATP-binding protein [Lacticaseibacillus absianus]